MQRAQRHLDSAGFIHPADALQRRQSLLRREKLAPLVHYCYQTLPFGQRPGNGAQQGGLAAAGFSHYQQPGKVLLQQLVQLGRQRNNTAACDPQVERGDLLQGNALPFPLHELPRHAHAVTGSSGQVALGKLPFVGVHRSVAKRVEDLLYLQCIQPYCGQCRWTARQCQSRALPPLYGKCDRTACAQAQLLYACRRLCGQLCQRRCQPSGKGFDGLVILVHFWFSFRESFVLALYALCASLEPGTGKQKSLCNSIAEAFEIIYISAFGEVLQVVSCSTGASCSMARNSCSVSTGTPSACALVSLEPAAVPATT